MKRSSIAVAWKCMWVVLLAMALFVVACSTAEPPADQGGGGSQSSGAGTEDEGAATELPSDPQEAYDLIMSLSGEEREQTLIRGAEADGAVVFYHSVSAEMAEEMVAEFQSKYPFLQVENQRLSTGALIERIQTEHRAGSDLFDVTAIPSAELYVIKEEGLVGRYLSPQREGIFDIFQDEEGYYAALLAEPTVFGFNTQRLSKEEVPRSLKELVDPKWRGRIGRTTNGGRFVAALEHLWGPEEARSYLEQLAQQDVWLNTSNSGLGNDLTTGVIDLSFDHNMGNVWPEIEQGAPVDLVIPEEAFFLVQHAAISAHAPHPYAAMLFVDWLLSKEASDIAAKHRGVPGPRIDVNPEYVVAADIEEVHRLMDRAIAYSPELVGPNYEEREAYFQSLFVR